MLGRAPRGESRAPLPHVRVVTGDGNDGRKRVGTVIAVANQKGGVGKTTCTINLGGALASLGHRVLCLDLDPQANLTVGLGIDLNTVEKNIANVLIDPDLKITSIIRHEDEEPRRRAGDARAFIGRGRAVQRDRS